MRHALQDVNDRVLLSIGVLCNDLEWSEELCGQQLAFLGRLEMLERHEDSSGLPGAIALRNGVILERSSSEKDFSTVKLKNRVQVSLDALVVPREHWANSQVLEAPPSCLRLHLVEKSSLPPVAVHEKHGLRRALLPSVRIRILITLVGDIVDISLLFGHVRSKDLPVIAAVLELDFATELLGKVLADARRAREERHSSVGLLENLLHDGAVAVKQVHVLFREAAMVQHADPLLEDDRDARITLDQRLVSHVKSTHELEDWEIGRAHV